MKRLEETGSGSSRGLMAGILLAFALWIVAFVIRPLNFWLMMSFSTSLLAATAFIFGRPLISRRELTWKNILLGILSAAVLYALFLAGNQALILLSRLFPALIPDRAGNLGAVYANREILSPLLVGLLLFFPIGFGEELFWRGFVQRRLASKWSPLWALIATTLLYTAVHLATGNPVLILAALTCGAFWGGLYMIAGTLVPVLVSHMVWDPFIFVIRPIY